MEKFIQFIGESENIITDNFKKYSKKLGYSNFLMIIDNNSQKFIHNISKFLINNSIYIENKPDIESISTLDKSDLLFLIKQMDKYVQYGLSLSEINNIINYFKYSYIYALNKWDMNEEYKNLCVNYVILSFDYIQFKVCEKCFNINKVKQIEELKKENLKITDEKNKYLSIFESIPNPVIILDNNDMIDNMNYAATELFQNNNANIYKENPHEKEEFLWLRDELKYFSSGNYLEISFVKECKLLYENLFFKVKLKRIKINNNFIGIIVILDDITNSRKISEELEKSEKYLREITDNMRDMIFKIDINGIVQYFSPSAKEVLGYKFKDLIGKSIFSGVHSEDLDRIMGCFNKSLIGKDGTRMELRYRKQNGYYIWLEMIGNLLYGENGNVIGTIIVGRNITERKNTEEELKKAKLIAESENIAKSQFLANISQDIRRPLNEIIDRMDIILSTNLDDEQRECISSVKLALDSLFKIINNILDFSKIESGKMVLEEMEFNIRDILNEIVDALAIRAHEKNLEFMFYIYPDVDENLIGDPWKIKRIITNIVDNAIKFTEKGEVVIYIEKVKEDIDKVRLKISVIDTGIGIMEYNVNKLFKYFSENNTFNTKTYGGTGVGLAMSKQLLELMNGNLWFESKHKKGSKFYFTLDFKLQDDEQEIFKYNDLKNLNVLLIDDNKTNRTIVYNILANLGICTRFASSAEEGFTLIKEYAKLNKYFDAILIDEIMTGMDGFTLSIRIKKEIGITSPIIMMLSSVEVNNSKNKCKQIGVYDYIAKPIKQWDIYNVIKNALNIKGRTNLQTYSSSCKYTNKIKDIANTDFKQKMNVLIAEDNIINQKLMTTLIKKKKWDAFSAFDGEEILNILKNKKVDLILMDMDMVKTDVIEAIKEIRRKEQLGLINGRIPIIAITMYGMENNREECFKAGMDDYVSKPIVVAELYSKIEQIVKKSKNDYEEQSTLDLEQAMDATGGDEHLFKELVEICIQSFPKQIKSIKDAIEKKDAKELELKSHNLKGTVGNLGFKSIFKLAFELEEMGKNKNLKNAKKTFERVQLETIRLKSVLDKIKFNE